MIKIYHNPACGTSRNVLEIIRKSGVEPEIIEYLKTPPTRSKVLDIAAKNGSGVRTILREKAEPYTTLNLADSKFSDEQLVDFIVQYPILLNRPIVETSKGTRLCRPADKVLEIL